MDTERLMQCPVCGMGYVLPIDKKEHEKNHNRLLQESRIASRYSKCDLDLFESDAEECIIVDMVITDIGIFPKEMYHQDTPFYLHKNTCSSKEPISSMEDLCMDGFAVAEHSQDRWLYHLTYLGFQALARHLDSDLVCQPVEKV